jgi:hypothetical protein
VPSPTGSTLPELANPSGAYSPAVATLRQELATGEVEPQKATRHQVSLQETTLRISGAIPAGSRCVPASGSCRGSVRGPVGIVTAREGGVRIQSNGVDRGRRPRGSAGGPVETLLVPWFSRSASMSSAMACLPSVETLC